MADMFTVYDLNKNSHTVMNFKAVCDRFSNSNISVFDKDSIKLAAIYSSGTKIAVISKTEEAHLHV